MKGNFYFVGTPIGNLKDFSQNQIETLNAVEIILCEDTRTSKVLLDKFNIQKKLMSFHKFNYIEMTPKVINLLNEGNNIALISDAGLPVISDPGKELIPSLISEDIKYTVIGGVSAFSNAFILSGFDYPFTLSGFCLIKTQKKINLF